MDQLKRQVAAAHRRLLLQHFLRVLPWCLFGTLLAAMIGISLPKFFALPVAAPAWNWAWAGGALGLGLFTAMVLTYARRRSALDAAVEIDQRFRLKERVSSMLSLSEEELNTEAGQALMRDALRRIEGIDVRDEFHVRLGRPAWLPLLPAAIAFCVAMFLPNKEIESPAAAATATEAKQQIKRSTEDLRRKLAERRKAAKEKGLEDAEGLFKKLEQGTRDLNEKKDVDRKKAMVKLNDLAKELEQRRKAIGGNDKIRRQLNQLKDMAKGPAEKLAKAIRDGDFNKALDELKKLKDQLKNSQLGDEEKQQLAKQLEQMQEKLQQMADAHQKAMDGLKQQMEQAQAQGNAEQASKLQEQLDKLAQQAPQMDQLGKMAQQLSQAAQNLKQGDSQSAAQALDQLSQALDQMQQDAEELDMLQEALDQIAQAKDAMNCKACGGGGCKACGGAGKMPGAGGAGDNPNGQPGNGLGAGRGQGDRPIAEDQTGEYDTRVRQDPGKGKAVITDLVDGPNVKGQVGQDVKSAIEAAGRTAAEALTGQNLPRVEREHAQEYFDQLRDGE